VTSQDEVLIGSYDLRAVVLSIVIAILGAYAGLDLAERVTAARGRGRLHWLVGGVTATAIGIWSMHYTAMLGFRVPVPTQYDGPASFLSFLSAFFAAVVSLFVVTRAQMERRQVFLGSLFMGAGISGLHYIAMGAMRAPVMYHYDQAIVALSIAFAVGLSFLSLRLMFFFRGGDRGMKGRRAAGIVLLGTAISVMHYTGMAALTVTRSSAPVDLSHAVPISLLEVVAIGSIAVTLLGVVVVTSMFDRLQHERALLETTSEQLRALSASVGSAREAEGIRIARELHDELGSALTSLKWDLETVSAALAKPIDQATVHRLREQLEGMTRAVDVIVGAVKRIAADLRPSVLDDLGLLDAIEWQTQRFQVATGTACGFDRATEEVALTPAQSTAVFRILQEALTNIRRHANASTVEVRAAIEDGAFVLRIRDNGRGITEQQRSAPRALGIIGMRERAVLIGASFDVTGSPTQGTTITVRLAFPAPEDIKP
jgi:signal transduction histidine kinase